MHDIFELIGHVAETTTTVLIEGETGTGKEQVARAIHHASAKHRSGPFVAVNCAALPRDPAGERAVRPREGRVHRRRPASARAASSWPTAARSSSTRSATCRRRCRPSCCACCRSAGSSASAAPRRIEVDVRVVAATNREPAEAGQGGEVPRGPVLPAERGQDRPAAAARAARGHPAAGGALRAEVRPARTSPPSRSPPRRWRCCWRYRWPGNIRELENAIERACVTSRGEQIPPENLPPEVAAPARTKVPVPGRPGPAADRTSSPS